MTAIDEKHKGGALLYTLCSLLLCAALAGVVAVGIAAAGYLRSGKVAGAAASYLSQNRYVMLLKGALGEGGSSVFLKKVGFSTLDYIIGAGELPDFEPEDMLTVAALLESSEISRVELDAERLSITILCAERALAESAAGKLRDCGVFKSVELAFTAENDNTEYSLRCVLG